MAREGQIQRTIGATLLAALPMFVFAQEAAPPVVPFNAQPQNTEAPREEFGGTPTIDTIVLRATGPGAPLRYGNVVPGTDRVYLNGRLLKAGDDYSMDYAAGVVYLKRMQKAGDSLMVAYRYKQGQASSTPAAGFVPTLKFDIAPKGLSMMMGLGMAERAADGSVMMSNIFGLNNSLALSGGGKLSGLFLVGERDRQTNRAGLNLRGDSGGQASSQEQGTSSLILQQFRSKLMGGDIEADYQEVSQNFAAFNSAKEAGVDDAQIQAMARERGLSRFSLAMRNVKMGAVSVSNSFKSVADGSSGIEWRSLGFAQGDVAKGNGFAVNFSSQRVDSDFKRFKDIREGDREQLLRERGMARESLSGEIAQKFGKLSFTSNSIEDTASGKGLQRREVKLDTSSLKFAVGDQEVDGGFGRIGSLLGQEQALFGRELGMKRQWMSIQTTLFGAGTPIQFSQSILSRNGDAFTARDASIQAKTWSLNHTARSADSKFTAIGAMQDAEIDANIRTIANMYGPGAAPRPEDRGRFFASSGISREFTRLEAQPFAGWKTDFSHLQLRGAQDGGTVSTLNIAGKNVQLSLRKQELGAKFGEIASLMEFERQRLGPVAGMNRLDASLNAALGPNRSLAASLMEAKIGNDPIRRTSIAVNDPKLQMQANIRSVGARANTGALVDNERDLLNSLRGFDQADARIRWQILPNMRVDAFWFDAKNTLTDEIRRIRDASIDWQPDKTLRLNFVRRENRTEGEAGEIFSQLAERIAADKDFGRFGVVNFWHEHFANSGSQNPSPDVWRTFIAFETKLNSSTRVRTEQTLTNFEGGNRETVNSNTISTQLTKGAGVSVTDTRVNRPGTERDETKRNYGFWLELPGGFRLSYGYARQLNGTASGGLQSAFVIGQGAQAGNADQVGGTQQARVGDFNVGGGYGVNEWENGNQTRTQAFSRIGLGTAKPLSFLGLKNVQFDVNFDSASDQAQWMREGKTARFSAELDTNKISYQYLGVMHPSGYRGIDRVFQFETNNNPKKFLTASLYYKLRTLPWDDQVMIRNYSFTIRPLKDFEINHQLTTNPEVFRSDVFLGSLPQAARSNRWRLDYKQNADTTVGMMWEELINEQNRALTRTGGVNVTLFQKSGSPLRLFYGLEQGQGNRDRSTVHRYHLQFDQKPGPNQSLSIFMGNISYEHLIVDGVSRNNLTLRLDYQFRF